MIPLILRLRVKDKNSRKFGIWFPLFLLWLVVLPLLALPAPVIFIFSLIAWSCGTGRKIWLLYTAVFTVICNLSGLHFEINSKEENVYIDLK
jgi:hypothetical protein